MREPSRGTVPFITEVGQYCGEAAVRVSATQLGTAYTATAARRVVDRWCEFFAGGPSPIIDLEFSSRTPKRLFASLQRQTQLTALRVKWGDYDDLTILARMTQLTQLHLGAASAVHTLVPLTALPQLQVLSVESLRHVHDLTPLGTLTELVDLEVGGNWIAPRAVHVDSLAFLRQLSGLRRLILHTMIVDDADYSPLLAHSHTLTEVRVAKARRMRPTHDELCAAIPALQPIRPYN